MISCSFQSWRNWNRFKLKFAELVPKRFLFKLIFSVSKLLTPALSLSLSLCPKPKAQSPTQKLFQVSSVFAWMNESGVQRMKLEIEIVRSSSFKEISNYFFFLNREIEAELKTLRDTFYWWLWLTIETTQMFDALVFLKKQGCQTSTPGGLFTPN